MSHPPLFFLKTQAYRDSKIPEKLLFILFFNQNVFGLKCIQNAQRTQCKGFNMNIFHLLHMHSDSMYGAQIYYVYDTQTQVDKT